MTPLDISANALALALHVPANRISAIANGSRSITADTALRLARHLGTTAEYWMNLQAAHDLSLTQAALGRRLAWEVRVRERT